MLRTGIDIIEIERVQGAIARHGDRFLARIFTPLEISQNVNQVASLAARFAAKEATAKALGCGIGDISWLDIEILRAEKGQPQLHLHGNALALAETQGLHEWAVSLSHSQSLAIAIVVVT